MTQHQPVDISEEDLQRANDMWHGFTKAAKWSTISVGIILALMGLLLIDW